MLRRLICLVCLVTPLHARSDVPPAASSGTVPFIFDDNRMFAELTFVRPNGTARKAMAFVDLGTPVMVLKDTLFKELQIGPARPLVFRVGGLDIGVDSSAIQTDTGSPMTGPDGKATMPVEAVLPGSVMKNYQVVFDYAKRTLTMAQPGTLELTGVAVPCRVNENTGLISVSAIVAGQSYALAVDSGSAYSWVRQETARQWLAAHPGWKRGTGAVGEANMQTRADGAEAGATILRLPRIDVGALRLERIGALGIAPDAPPFPPVPGGEPVQGSFFDWYSKKAPEPVVGWLGGNVLKGFRIAIDFPRRTTYWTRERPLDPHDLDQVGLTLARRDSDRAYIVAGIAEKDGKPAVAGVRVGDKLVEVDGLRLATATRGAVFAALHGRAGSVRVLVLERDGTPVKLKATITAF